MRTTLALQARVLTAEIRKGEKSPASKARSSQAFSLWVKVLIWGELKCKK